MAASRLSDAQKDEIVAAFRQGATATALASAFGCSPNTVSRVVKTALSPEDYAALKLQRGKGEAGVAPPDANADADAATQGSTDEPVQEEVLPAAVAVAAVAVAAEARPGCRGLRRR
jgi:transposase-like protein